MRERNQGQKRLTVCVIFVCFLSMLIGGYAYLSSVRTNLLNQVVSNLLTVTQQQQKAFDNFISRDRERIHSFADDFAKCNSYDYKAIREKLALFSEVEAVYSIVDLETGVFLNNKTQMVYQMVPSVLEEYSSFSGSGVRDPYEGLYLRTTMFGYYELFTFADGVQGLLQKGYDSTKVSSDFSLSFYNDKGFAYVVNKEGDILLRSIEDAGDFAGDNIFEIVNSDGKNQARIDEFTSAFERQETGVSFLQNDVEKYVYTYVPVENVEEWYLVSVVPESAIMEDAEKVINSSQAMVTILTLVFIVMLTFFYLIWRSQKNICKKDMEIEYQEELFNVFFAYLSNNTNDIYMMLDKKTHEVEYISPNVKRILGISIEDMINNPEIMNKTLVSDKKYMGFDIIDDLEPGQKIAEPETERINLITSEHLWFLETLYCVMVKDTQKVIICLSDRTNEKNSVNVLKGALESAEIANKAKSTFLSSVSHDIRTPMNAIMGLTTLLKDEINNPEHILEYTGKIDSASQHLLGLINDVLDMNKIESGSTTLNVSEIDISEIIDEINIIIRPQARAKNQQFEIYTSPFENEHLLGDKMRINQILINILSNAVKYTQEGGRIVMSVKEIPQDMKKFSVIQFSVADNGQGMSEEYQKVMFDPFTREQNSTTNKIQGTGLGMAITKNLVDLMGGTIHVESKEGEGSTFTVELRLRAQDREDDIHFWDNHGVRRMIVADDDEDICKNIVKAMKPTGVEVDYATTGNDVIETMRKAREAGRPYDLVLLDWRMPELDGMETARLIKKNYPEKIPILLFTAYDWSDIEEEAIKIGIDHFLPKPFFMTNFKLAVERIMAKKEEKPDYVIKKEESVLNGLNALMVEDIDINRLVLGKIMTARGATYDVAENGREAVEMFENSEPGQYDIILMDVQMPVMDGYEATRNIRTSSHPDAKAIPIVAMTANAFAEDVQNALDAGMNGHVSKPITLKQLETTLRRVLGKDEVA